MSVLHTIQNEKKSVFLLGCLSFQNKNLEYLENFITNNITQKKTELVHGLQLKKNQ